MKYDIRAGYSPFVEAIKQMNNMRTATGTWNPNSQTIELGIDVTEERINEILDHEILHYVLETNVDDFTSTGLDVLRGRSIMAGKNGWVFLMDHADGGVGISENHIRFYLSRYFECQQLLVEFEEWCAAETFIGLRHHSSNQ